MVGACCRLSRRRRDRLAAFFAALVLYGPPACASMLLAMVGGGAGLITLALGSSAKTAATLGREVTERLSITVILSIATTIFVRVLVILLS